MHYAGRARTWQAVESLEFCRFTMRFILPLRQLTPALQQFTPTQVCFRGLPDIVLPSPIKNHMRFINRTIGWLLLLAGIMASGPKALAQG